MVKFDGTIVITDPCYLRGPNDLWDKPDVDILNGDGIDKYGFTTYIWTATIYGDWSCSVVDDYGDLLGNFCADSGMVGVFLLDEITKHNPDYNIESEIKNGSACRIENFNGNIEIDQSQGYTRLIGSGSKNFVNYIY
jgi:hypothetical protein